MIKSNNKEIIEQFGLLGFTLLESEIYLYLLTNGVNTGYAVAKGIDKAVANVYKGIQSLTNKGAVITSEADSKICQAVAWQDVLAAEKSRFESGLTSLTQQLEQLPEQFNDESVYQLKNITQVLNATQTIIEESQSILVAEFEPKAAEYFSPYLIDAAKRGVEVRVKVYQPLLIPGAHIVLRQSGEDIYNKTDDVSFKVCGDGKEFITVALKSDFNQVIQAFKTKSALVCMDNYCGLIYELILTELKQLIPLGDIKKCQNILKETAHLHPFSTKNSVFGVYQKRYHLNK